MKRFKADNILSKNSGFRLEKIKDKWFFSAETGWKVQTDKIARAVWEKLPGSVEEIMDKIKAEYIISSRMLEDYLYLLFQGGMVLVDKKSRREVVSSVVIPGEKAELISAVVVTYNGSCHIGDCFSSLTAQSYKNIEIIAVDNASTDDTVKILEKDYPGVKTLSLKKNRHFAGGVNYGIKHARGDYVFVLNQDVELDKDCVSQLYYKIREEKNTGAAVPLMKFFGLRGFVNGLGNHIKNYGWGSDNFIGCVDIGQFGDIQEVPSACFGAVFLSREAVEEVGMLDESYRSFYEDVDWSFRCWLKGRRIVPAPKAVVYHKFGASYKEDIRKLKLVIRNRQRLVLKLFQGKILGGFLKRYFKEDLKTALSQLKRKNISCSAAYIWAYLSLLSYLPDILIKRRRILRKKLKSRREKFVLEKNPEFTSALNDENFPVLDSQKIFEYYRWELMKK